MRKPVLLWAFIADMALLAGITVAQPMPESKPRELPEPSSAIRKPLPDSIEDLKDIQKQTKAVYDTVLPTVVGIFKMGAAGSGVLVSKDGLVLTAGHVSGTPNQPVTIVMANGKRMKGITLGRYEAIDSGMIRITDKLEKGDFPFAKMAKPREAKVGDWCVALGHPGGYREGRTAVLRLGKVLRADDNSLMTDCTLVGGDSGGPLFDMQGRVIGIHSRIQESVSQNVHVPIATYRDTWPRLLKGAEIGTVWIGLNKEDGATECKIGSISKDSPAEKAGLKVGDVMTRFDNQVIGTYEEMRKLLMEKDPGDEIELEIKRDDQIIQLKMKLARRPDLGGGRFGR